MIAFILSAGNFSEKDSKQFWDFALVVILKTIYPPLLKCLVPSLI